MTSGQGKQAGTHCRVKSPNWYGWVGARAVPLCTNKEAAEQMLSGLVRKAERAEAGLVEPCDEHRKRPLAEHLADFKRALAAKGNTPQHVELTVSRVQAMLDATKAVRSTDLDLAKGNEWLAGMREDGDPVVPPEGKAEFSPLETARVLKISTQSVREAVKRHGPTVTGKGNGRRLPRTSVEYLCRLAARGISAESVNHYVRAIRGSCAGWSARPRGCRQTPLRGWSSSTPGPIAATPAAS